MIAILNVEMAFIFDVGMNYWYTRPEFTYDHHGGGENGHRTKLILAFINGKWVAKYDRLGT